MREAVVPFEVDIPPDALDDLRSRLHRTRFAGDFGNDDWSFGVPTAYLRELVGYWATQFDWRAQQASMNRFAHYRTEIGGVPVHFVHERGRGPAPMPLVLTHGWPWTFWDYQHLIGPLSDPAAFGGDPRDAFDVVVPSLPGTAFSSPLATTGIGVLATADLWLALMRDRLGYDRFAAAGGDSGAFVTARLGHTYGAHVIGIHLSFPATVTMAALGTVRPDDYSAEEQQWLAEPGPQARGTGAHMAVHVEGPQTLAAGLNDSPAGLAAWIVERRRNWSDCDGDVERRFSKDELLTCVSLYWLTGTFHTSVRFYAESFRAAWPLAHGRTPPIEVPTAVAVFPRELLRVPRRFMERQANVARWTVMPRGGHFAPAEEPDLMVDDIRAFFRDLR
ncbi:MAG TPA: epoxide hydrolase [Acidimicrobiales bacterium]|nr:epoxide hydrolase [Acidimicrobiales bacterium]